MLSPYLRRLPVLAAVITLVASLTLPLTGTLPPTGIATSQMADLRFVDSADNPLPNATLRVLCYGTAAADPLLADLFLETDTDGRPVQPLPGDCSFLAALRLLHTQPSGKAGHGPAYQVYATSWLPGTRQALPATGDISLRDDSPLVLFNILVSLEWEPAGNSPFLADLRDGLFNASASLYDLTEGQMVLGIVEVYTGGRAWDSADLRFLAANDARPVAYVGGIVAAPTPYTTPAGTAITYAPAEIVLGRFWDGEDASDPSTGRWSQEAAFRTLVHEWAHYALFLHDEYQDASGGGRSETYCTCADLPQVGVTPGACGGVSPDLAASAMAYQYTASELWLADRPSVCLMTEQARVHGEPDWETLLRWAAIQKLPAGWLRRPPSLTPGPPLGLTSDLFRFQSAQPLGFRGVEEPTVNVAVSGTFTLDELNALYPQVYLLEGVSASGTLIPGSRILYQGTTVGPRRSPGDLGTITLLGGQRNSQVRVFIDRYGPAGAAAGRFVYAAPDSIGPILEAIPFPWRASLDVDYEMTGPVLTSMTVALISLDPLSAAPVAQVCTPAAGIGCPDTPAWRKTMVQSGPMTWTAAFTAEPGMALPHRGIIRVEAPGVGELVRWFQDGGGVGPAHIFAEAPLRDGAVTIDATQPVSGERNRVSVMPAASYEAVVAPLPPGIGGIVGFPLDLDILLPGGAPPSSDRPLPVPVVLTLFYSQDVIDRLGVREDRLRLLHFSRRTGAWETVPISGRSEMLNWLSTVPVSEDGIYAIGFTAEVTPPTPVLPPPPPPMRLPTLPPAPAPLPPPPVVIVPPVLVPPFLVPPPVLVPPFPPVIIVPPLPPPQPLPPLPAAPPAPPPAPPIPTPPRQ